MFHTRTSVRVLTLLSAAALLLPPVFGQRTWFFSGSVAMEDGSPPAVKVTIESVCGGAPRPETYTDTKGQFHFTLGGNEGEITMDSSRSGMSRGAAIPGGIDSNTLGECSVRAVLAGYRSSVVVLTGRKIGESPDLGTIVLRKLGAAEGPTVSVKSLQAPKDAQKAFDKAAEAAKSKKWDDAVASFRKAVELYPQYAEAWYDMGKIQASQNQTDAARASFEQATKVDEKYILPYLELANLDSRAQNWKALVDVTTRVMTLAPASFPQAYLFNAVANFSLGNLDAAGKSALEGQKVDAQRQSPKLWQVLGMVLANKGDFAGAAEQFKKYLEYAPSAPDAATTRAQIAECEKQMAK